MIKSASAILGREHRPENDSRHITHCRVFVFSITHEVTVTKFGIIHVVYSIANFLLITIQVLACSCETDS